MPPTLSKSTPSPKKPRNRTQRRPRVVLLPTIPYGTETNMCRFPLAMNLNPTTVARVIGDLVASLANHKIHKCLILNGHGGNDLKWVLRELHETTPVQLFLCNWYHMCADVYPTIFAQAEDHAGEMETSLGLAHFSPLGDARSRRRGDEKTDEVRSGQSRLGRDHPTLALAHDQLRRGRPAASDRRQRPRDHQGRRRSRRLVSEGVGREQDRGFIPVLILAQ